MENQPLPLGAQIAGLRSAALAQERCAWIPPAIHALIIACLARLLGRLAEMLQLWQSGQLPLPATTPTRTKPTRATSKRTSRSGTARHDFRSPRRTPRPIQAPRARHPNPAHNPAPSPHASPPRPRTRAPSSRAPPGQNPPKTTPTALANPCLIYSDIETM